MCIQSSKLDIDWGEGVGKIISILVSVLTLMTCIVECLFKLFTFLGLRVIWHIFTHDTQLLIHVTETSLSYLFAANFGLSNPKGITERVFLHEPQQ